MDPRDAFLDASVWHGTLDDAQATLAAHPEIAACDIYTAAILGDAAAVARFLANDPASVTAKGGPRGWDALTYLCFSKYLRLERARTEDFVRAATALLNAGASANSGFWEQGHQPNPEWESVLYGAAGVAHHPEMTRLLLDRGADPNDGEVAYHSPETLDNRALKVLVESGKLTPVSLLTMLLRKLNWHDDLGVAWLLERGVDTNLLSPWGGRTLHHALKSVNPIGYFELLLDRGADPTLPNKDGVSATALAARMARADVLDLFERRGFATALEGDDALLAEWARGRKPDADSEAVKRIEAGNSGLLVDFAGAGNLAAVRVLLDLGFDIGASRSEPRWLRGETALHVAAGRGLAEMADLLIERGAPLEAVNRAKLTPLGVAFRSLVEQSEWTPNDRTVGIAQALLKAGARLDAVEVTLAAAICLGLPEPAESTAADRQEALSAAARNGSTEGIARLMRLGVDLNAPNRGLNPGAFALHNAVCSGSLETVKMLVDAGADAQAKDASYQATALDWAEHYAGAEGGNPAKRYAEIVAYLSSLPR